MNIRWLLFLLLLLPFACKNKVVKLPMEEDKVVKILADVHVAEAAMQSIYGDVKDSLAVAYYDQIYEMNDIKKEEFDSLLAFLYRSPGAMDSIYSKVLIVLKQEEAKYDDRERYEE